MNRRPTPVWTGFRMRVRLGFLRSANWTGGTVSRDLLPRHHLGHGDGKTGRGKAGKRCSEDPQILGTGRGIVMAERVSSALDLEHWETSLSMPGSKWSASSGARRSDGVDRIEIV